MDKLELFLSQRRSTKRPSTNFILPWRVLHVVFCFLVLTRQRALSEATTLVSQGIVSDLQQSAKKNIATVPLLKIIGGASDSATVQEAPTEKMALNKDDIQIVFSDVDGTLVHYPEDAANIKGSVGNQILKLPPSATGMQGIISSRTLSRCQELRRGGKKLVIISGMRTSTLMKRLPYLPRADAYCSEAGGRIFYSVEKLPEAYNGVTVTPDPYDGAQPNDLAPFGIKEDSLWRGRMERLEAAGSDGYIGAEMAISGNPVPISDRKGLLWEFARTLMAKGFVLDTKGYSSCFRVNRKQQNAVSDEEFDALASGQMDLPAGLSTSVNLGCVDFYPAESGKKNCCKYLAQKFCNTEDDSVLSKHAVCLCDDDNDLEMALACRHAYLPGVSSASMAQVIQENPDQITLTGGSVEGAEGTFATEAALALVLERVALDK